MLFFVYLELHLFAPSTEHHPTSPSKTSKLLSDPYRKTTLCSLLRYSGLLPYPYWSKVLFRNLTKYEIMSQMLFFTLSFLGGSESQGSVGFPYPCCSESVHVQHRWTYSSGDLLPGHQGLAAPQRLQEGLVRGQWSSLVRLLASGPWKQRLLWAHADQRHYDGQALGFAGPLCKEGDLTEEDMSHGGMLKCLDSNSDI